MSRSQMPLDVATNTTAPLPVVVDWLAIRRKSGWSTEVGSGILWSNVRDPNIPGYTLINAELTFARACETIRLTKPFGGIFEGQPEFLLRGNGMYVKNGVESHIGGFGVGARYNFVHADSRWTPYAETIVGLAWADSRPFVRENIHYGLGQDFNFNFAVGTGIRYHWTENWNSRLGIVYSHYSNGGLSEPRFQNRAIDALGFNLTLGRSF